MERVNVLHVHSDEISGQMMERVNVVHAHCDEISGQMMELVNVLHVHCDEIYWKLYNSYTIYTVTAFSICLHRLLHMHIHTSTYSPKTCSCYKLFYCCYWYVMYF